MALKIIGAGLGRTGTVSLQHALEHLGFGKCYHMFTLIKYGDRVEHWEKLTRNEQPDFDALFKGYQSTVSSLSACFYKQLMKQYPDAKVILTFRDAEDWYRSGSKTSFRKTSSLALLLCRSIGLFSKRYHNLWRVLKCTNEFLYDGLFEGKMHDKEFMKTLFNDWNTEVKRSVPAGKLLVYEVKDGWEPLCEFLQVPVPDIPFPKLNERNVFHKNVIKSFLHHD